MDDINMDGSEDIKESITTDVKNLTRKREIDNDYSFSSSSNSNNNMNNNINNNFDDLLNQLTSGFSDLNTTEGTINKQELITRFLEVLPQLQTYNEAEFYLESSNFDITLALTLYLETFSGSNNNDSFQFGSSSSSSNRKNKKSKNTTTTSTSYATAEYYNNNEHYKPKYLNKQIYITDENGLGLPDGWIAKISSSNGTVYFENILSGRCQSEVPPNYADVVDYPSPNKVDNACICDNPIPSLNEFIVNDTDDPTILSSSNNNNNNLNEFIINDTDDQTILSSSNNNNNDNNNTSEMNDDGL